MAAGYIQTCTARLHVWEANDEELPNGAHCQCTRRQFWDERPQAGHQTEYVVEVQERDGTWKLGAPHEELSGAVQEANNLAFAQHEEVTLRIRFRFVGGWAEVAAFALGRPIAPTGWGTWWTIAPAAYDGFGTHTLATDATTTPVLASAPRSGWSGCFRLVAVDPKHLTWQRDRYSSGNYRLLSEEDYRKALADGVIIGV